MEGKSEGGRERTRMRMREGRERKGDETKKKKILKND